MIDRENQARSEILATKMGRLKDVSGSIKTNYPYISYFSQYI